MAENANSEPDNPDSGDPEEAREFGAREVGGEAESRQADNRGLSADNVGGEDGDGALNPGRAEGQGELDAAPSEDGAGQPEDGSARPEDGAGQPEDGSARPEDGAGQPEDGAAEADDQEPGKVPCDTYQIFGKEFRDSQVEELDALLSSLGEDIEGLRETKDQMVEALLAIPDSLPGTNLDEAAEAAAKAVEKRQEDFISRLEELRGDIAEEVDFAKWRHELADGSDRRSGKEDGGTASFE